MKTHTFIHSCTYKHICCAELSVWALSVICWLLGWIKGMQWNRSLSSSVCPAYSPSLLYSSLPLFLFRTMQLSTFQLCHPFPISLLRILILGWALWCFLPIAVMSWWFPAHLKVAQCCLGPQSTWRRGRGWWSPATAARVIFQRAGMGGQRPLGLRKEEDYGVGWGEVVDGVWHLNLSSTRTPYPIMILCGRVTRFWLPEFQDRRRATVRRTNHFPMDPVLPGPSLPFNIL